MGLKKYFTGKTGFAFWLNVFLAIVVLITVPVLLFNCLDSYTHHGEKLSVPSVIGKRAYEAESILDKKGFVAVISDSTYRKSAKPGAVLDQNPKAGIMVKSGRIIYLTINLYGEPLVKIPDLAHNSSLREAEVQLHSLGFKTTAPKFVPGQAKDLVLMIKQGRREVHSGEMVSKERALTIYAGAGIEESDTVYFEDDYSKDSLINTEEIHESNFDVQL
ncbi:MAG: PASTA domain-containing protein [Bacteroidaceae bacterium]|nr:PASTA domain-containing protein [Bacteroidaceae bacterium]